MSSPLPYSCPSTHSRFLSTSTCSARRAKAASKEPLTIGTVFDAMTTYEPCKTCSGPIRVADGVQVEAVPKVPVKMGFGRSGVVDAPMSTHIAAAKDRREKMSQKWRFDHYGPDEIWTGSTCGCTKARKHFSKMNLCDVHLREYDAERRRKAGIPKKKQKRVCACGKEYYAKGLCYSCYQINWKAQKRKGAE